MRLRDIGRGDEPLPAEIEAELDALDAALSGEQVPPGMEGLETLVNDMRAERAAPDDEFGAALDHWAAAGFPRGRQPRLSEKATASDAGGRFRLFLASLTPRRLAYAGGAAATLVVLVVGVSQIDFDSARDDSAGVCGRRQRLSRCSRRPSQTRAVPRLRSLTRRENRRWRMSGAPQSPQSSVRLSNRGSSRPSSPPPAASPAASKTARSSATRR